MFTGLVQCVGSVRDAAPFGRGKRFRIALGEIAAGANVGQSIAVNGVCLTITSLAGGDAAFDAVSETLARTNLGLLTPGSKVNLEPALKAGGALDGHIVLGHVDAMANVIGIRNDSSDNRVLTVALPPSIRHLVAEKGSIAINGISLTVADAGDDWFTVAVIPHSWENTTLSLLRPGEGVNLEADVMARYAARILQCAGGGKGMSEDFLRQHGFA